MSDDRYSKTDNPDYLKDNQTGALVSSKLDEFKKFKMQQDQYEKTKTQENDLNNIKSEVSDLKNELGEIKDILKLLLNK